MLHTCILYSFLPVFTFFFSLAWEKDVKPWKRLFQPATGLQSDYCTNYFLTAHFCHTWVGLLLGLAHSTSTLDYAYLRVDAQQIACWSNKFNLICPKCGLNLDPWIPKPSSYQLSHPCSFYQKCLGFRNIGGKLLISPLW